MKIDMMESLGYSFLRHVQDCWIVQTNWKASIDGVSDTEWKRLTKQFDEMRRRFGDDVFEGTETVQQLLRQAEIDVVGVAGGGTVHALEAAFHERGLEGAQCARVHRKMLRTVLVLEALAMLWRKPDERHIWFVSPKVTRKPAGQLKDMFTELRRAYSQINWHLHIGQSFRDVVMNPTLAAALGTSDTSELFVRAERVLRGRSGR